MSNELALLSSRRDFSTEKLAGLGSRIEKIDVLREMPDLCIYVTGSFGRLEASKHSDLDLFFIHKGAFKSNPVPRIQKTLLDADLIRITRDSSFPDFSNDGEYLTVHYLDDIRDAIGGPYDDFKNYFTARMLLLLESRSLYNKDFYACILKTIVESYYRDYHDHETSFRPVFLINDIMRFWRTLCLNYEHRRNRPSDSDKKNRSFLLNLKLKFSRLLTCYSAVVLLSIKRDTVNPDDLLEIVQLSPLDRLDRVADMVPGTREQVTEMKRSYSWFLEKTARTKHEVFHWIADPGNRNDAFCKGREFATQMYGLLLKVTEGTDTMRFLVV